MPGNSLKVGVHMLRKTAYLVAIWGDGEFEHVMSSARHSTFECAKVYAKDALWLKELGQIYNSPDNFVGKWKSVAATQLSQAATLNLQSDAYGMTLHNLAKVFVEDSLAIRGGHMHDLLSAALRYIEPSEPETKLKNKLKDIGLASEVVAEIRDLMEEVYATRLQQKSVTQEANERIRETAIQDSNQPGDELYRLGKRKRGGENNLDGREQLSSLPTLEEKIRKLLELDSSFETNGELTEAARKFVVRTLNPILGCFRHHFNGDEEAFVRSWREKFRMRFGESCCHGKKDNECNIAS